MKSYRVLLLVEFENGFFDITLDAKSQEDAEQKAKECLIDSYPIFKNRKISVYN